MPREVRRLVFTHAESTKAIVNYSQQFDMSFPQGRIIKAQYTGSAEYEFHTMKSFKSNIHDKYNVKENAKSIIITFFDETTFEHKFYNLTADFLSAALIEYCIDKNIMMPKEAQKTLDLTEFNICLDINYEKSAEGESLSNLEFEEDD